MLKRLVTALATLVLAAGALVATGAPANAAENVWCDPESSRCYLTISAPSDPAPNPDSNGWTAGAPACYSRIDPNYVNDYPNEDVVTYEASGVRYFYVKIGCGNGLRYWSNSRQCFVSMVEGEWPARPGSYSQEAGYYVCAPYIDQGATLTSYFWSETIPPGLKVLTPGSAAEQLISTFGLRGIDIGMAPEVNPEWGHRRGYVGVPIWLWVDNPEPLTWGPYTETATLGGQTITATAKATSVRWQMGDGASTTCGNTGTPYNTGYGMTTSPTCGYKYTTTSSRMPGDRFTVNATTSWTVTWTSLAGPGGTINLTTDSSTDLEVNELQTVIVP